MPDQDNGWSEYSRLVLKELETLATSIQALNSEIQELKQHHVHPPSGDKGERMPLTHCRRQDNPSKCKSDFPRTSWLIEKAVVLLLRDLYTCKSELNL